MNHIDYDKVFRGKPEPGKRNQIRQEEMKLRPTNYGTIRSLASQQTGTCIVCMEPIYGEHRLGNTVHNWCRE